MKILDQVRSKCKLVSTLAVDVKISHQAIERLADNIYEDVCCHATKSAEPSSSIPAMDKERTAAVLLAWNAINFCYFPDPKSKRWRWLDPETGVELGGDDEALAVRAALQHWISVVIQADGPLAIGRWLQSLFEEKLRETIFKAAPGCGELPMLQDRADNLRTLGKALQQETALALVTRAQGSAERLVEILITEDHLKDVFKDEWEYTTRCNIKGEESVATHTVPFYKRAQLSVSMLCAAGIGGFDDSISKLTVFADYRIPQYFRSDPGQQVLKLSPGLARIVDQEQLIAAGSTQEVELRAAMVHAGELLGDLLRKRQGAKTLTQAKLDYYLWSTAVRLDGLGQLPPFHRTHTTSY